MKFKTSAYILGLIGLALVTLLIAYRGFEPVYNCLIVAGWNVLWVSFFHLVPMFFDSLSWYVLVDHENRPSMLIMIWMRWIREGIDSLLPVAQIGGELIGARLLTFKQVSGSAAGASIIVDTTLSVITQIVFTLTGFILMILIKQDNSMIMSALAGIFIGIFCITGFIIAQLRGMFGVLVTWLSKISGENLVEMAGGAANLDGAIRNLYTKTSRLILASFWQLIAWIVGAGEVWLALYILGHPVSFFKALFLESLGMAVRNAAFAVPGSLGFQEGGYMVLVTVLGLNPEVGLALSLVKRVRELIFGIPALVHWQMVEGKKIWSLKKKPNPQKTKTGDDV